MAEAQEKRPTLLDLWRNPSADASVRFFDQVGKRGPALNQRAQEALGPDRIYVATGDSDACNAAVIEALLDKLDEARSSRDWQEEETGVQMDRAIAAEVERDEARAERDEARAEVGRLRNAIDHADVNAIDWQKAESEQRREVRKRDARIANLEAEVERLQRERTDAQRTAVDEAQAANKAIGRVAELEKAAREAVRCWFSDGIDPDHRATDRLRDLVGDPDFEVCEDAPLPDPEDSGEQPTADPMSRALAHRLTAIETSVRRTEDRLARLEARNG